MNELLDVLNDKYDLYRLLTGELEIDDVLSSVEVEEYIKSNECGLIEIEEYILKRL